MIKRYNHKPDFVSIISVPNHSEHKRKLLYFIEEMIEENNIQLNEKGYYYDFPLRNVKRTYGDLFKHILKPIVKQHGASMGLKYDKRLESNLPWFQQYLQGSDFGWHQHDGHFAVVYYVELPDSSESTDFLQYGQFEVKEGDILLFPTFMVHRSPEITSNKRKTIISTNISYTVDRDYISQVQKNDKYIDWRDLANKV